MIQLSIEQLNSLMHNRQNLVKIIGLSKRQCNHWLLWMLYSVQCLASCTHHIFNKIWTDGFVVFVLGCHSKSQQQQLQPSTIILCKHVMFQLFYSVFPLLRDSNWHKTMLIRCCDCKLSTVHHVIGFAKHVNFTFSISASKKKPLIFRRCTLRWRHFPNAKLRNGVQNVQMILLCTNCELHSNDATFQKKENVRLVHQIKKLTPKMQRCCIGTQKYWQTIEYVTPRPIFRISWSNRSKKNALKSVNSTFKFINLIHS